MDIISKEMKTPRKNQKEMLEVKKTIKNSSDRLSNVDRNQKRNR